MNVRNILFVATTFAVLCLAGNANAACINPAGAERDIIYNQDYKLWQFCDGTDWWAMKSGGANIGGSAATAAGNEGEVQFNNAGSFGASPNLYWDDTNSRLGVGVSPGAHPLELGGEIKIGSTGASCTSANEGVMRYNTQLKMLQYCNGSYWTSNFGGSGTSLRSVQVFNIAGSHTWTRPAGITAVEVIVVAGGGGGCGDTWGLGGGGGGTCVKRLDVSSTSSQSVTVGAGGTGIGAGVANNGGSSSFGTYTADGGGGADCNNRWVGPGGTVSGCDLNIGGNDGYSSGGSSTLGGGGRCPEGGFDGEPGINGGGGGGASCYSGYTGTKGGDGGDGVVIIWEYGP